MTPEISVLLAVRDGEGTLKRTLDSLVAQTHLDWECVVIDDGSSDGSSDVARSVGDPRIRVLRQEPSGLTSALTRGIAETRGRFVARLDADDEALPGRLERQAALLESRADISAVGSAVELIDDSGKPFSVCRYPADHDGIVGELKALLTPLPHSTLMIRRDALLAAGGYRARFLKAQDYDLLLRLSERGRLANLEETLVRLRARPGSLTTERSQGEQMEYCVLGFISWVLRTEKGWDPLEGANVDAFVSEFRAWYPNSRYPRVFASRLRRREARMAASSGRLGAAAACIARATWDDPAWLLPRQLGAQARAWALARSAGRS